MTGEERRERIIQILTESKKPVSGRTLAETLQVSRQVIVQDMALLRARENHIMSTNLGYLILKTDKVSRVYKVHHSDEQVQEELNLIVDNGGVVEDVFISHRVYGTIGGELHIGSRKDVEEFLGELSEGSSGLLKNITSGYHYHTVSAPSGKILDRIQEELCQKGFLAERREYEPVDLK